MRQQQKGPRVCWIEPVNRRGDVWFSPFCNLASELMMAAFTSKADIQRFLVFHT